MKKHFPCGHRGKGQWCHRCAAEQAIKDREAAARPDPEQTVPDPVDMRRLPAHVRQRARVLLDLVSQGRPLRDLGGKWLQGLPRASIPIGKRWRILLREDAGQLRPVGVMSHEEYNHFC